jgi:hypothetical protein
MTVAAADSGTAGRLASVDMRWSTIVHAEDEYLPEMAIASSLTS